MPGTAYPDLGSSPRRPQFGRLAGLSWLHFLNDGSANYLPGVLPAALLALGVDPSWAGTVMSTLLIGQALQVVSGWFADRIGGRLFIVVGVLGSSLAAMLIGLAPSMWVLIPALLVIGMSNSLFHPQALAAAGRLSGDRRGLGMSTFLVGGEVGRGVWPLIASVVVVTWGLHALPWLAVPALISVPLLWRRLPVQPPRHPDAEPIVWRRHLGPAAALIGFSSLRALSLMGTVAFVPVLWYQQGHRLTEGASLITVLLVVGVVGNVGGGHFADRFGRRRVLLGSSVGGAVLLSIFLTTQGPWQWVVLGLLGIALFASLPIGIVIGQDIFPENPSLGSGIALGFSNGLAAVGLGLLGFVATTAGVTTVLWVLVASVLAAAAVTVALPSEGPSGMRR